MVDTEEYQINDYVLLLAHVPFCNDTPSGVAAQKAMLEPYYKEGYYHYEVMIEGGVTPMGSDWTVQNIDVVIDPQGERIETSTINCEDYVGCYWALVRITWN